jgi:Domain of unknown function (DUF4291)
MATDETSAIPSRQIRAVYDATTIRVYQAFRPEIADAAIAAGRFVPPFSRTRMTWIKPSFLWMMYRSGWGTKANQEHVLAIDITRKGFEQALSNAALTAFDPSVYADHAAWKSRIASASVQVQWDPEKTIRLQPLPYRSIQIGIGGEAVPNYVDDWTVSISSCKPLIEAIRSRIDAGQMQEANSLLPAERPFPLPPGIAAMIGAG